MTIEDDYNTEETITLTHKDLYIIIGCMAILEQHPEFTHPEDLKNNIIPVMDKLINSF